MEFLATLRDADSEQWSVIASAHAARWAKRGGEMPDEGEEIDPRESRAIAQTYGRIPAHALTASLGTYGWTLWRGVSDDAAFERLFASLFGTALFGIERSARRAALKRLPADFSKAVLREFEVLRSRAGGTGVEQTGLFELEYTNDFRQDIGRAVGATLGAIYADELATLCNGWSTWSVPRYGTRVPTALIAGWLSLFERPDG